MKWGTRARPKIDREAEFLYVPAADVMKVAQDTGATPYDTPASK